ncbi:hypothetical protein A3I25_00265 [Candidatus Nomurabacteria bacterium RIFCSPLOWO2_02_FULL_42_17]|uniref:Uncharacterized protein n=2 Tax=Candidatus Nomuraibacteriota TaxID=1752729 RepID=A0A1F6WHH8_9BACT|nr:MAG: hypothetical protein UV08_C0014G0006 [Parcubacteria group bacterium GW2011_GWA2_42_18]OGI81357.1 MAG: hypothetical protein A3B93_01235 [Candidatus Nomurabacteria bacterium RIFCSPHIGHO2_02_FULL_42_24]OGI97682.1 MAG: hypothetical protein A3I25_00265 [Candidatus Nomurabacteria bacterium RIFCSPLOWO2_02_FULL_42_17]
MIEIKIPIFLFYILFYLLIGIVMAVLVWAIIIEKKRDKIRKEEEEKKEKLWFEKNHGKYCFWNNLTWKEHYQIWCHLEKSRLKAPQN